MSSKNPMQIDNGLTTWGFSALTVIAAVNGVWMAFAACLTVTGVAWTVRWRRTKKGKGA